MRIGGTFRRRDTEDRSDERLTIEAGSDTAKRKDFCEWLTEHGVDSDNTYEVEIGETDMIVWQYHSHEGKKHLRLHCPLIQYPKEPNLLVSDGESDACRLAPFVVAVKYPYRSKAEA